MIRHLFGFTIVYAVMFALTAGIPCMAQDTGLAGFNEKGKWGFIDAQGAVIVKPVYDAVFDFSEGMARVLKKNKYGFVDAMGNEAIKTKYIAAMDFENGVAIVTEKNTKWLLATLMALAGAVQAGVDTYTYNGVSRYSLDHSDQLKYDNNARIIQTELHKNVTAAAKEIKTVFEVGLIDKTGREIIPAKYTSVERFKDNLYIASRWNGDRDNGGIPLIRYGLFDTGKNKEIMPAIYTAFGTSALADKGLVIVSTSKFKVAWMNYWEHRRGVVDYNNNVVIPLQYDILDASIFAPHERILVGEILKRTFANVFRPGDFKIERAKYGVLDHANGTIITLTECAGIALDGDMFVMTLASGEEKRFDLDGNEITK